MHKLIAIAVAGSVAAVIGLTVTKSEHAPVVGQAETLMPSILQVMSGARDLPSTPSVAP